MNCKKVYRIVFTAQERAEFVEVEGIPRPLTSLEVAGRTLVSLISAGTELAVYQDLDRQANFPYRSGYAAIFKVEAVGSEVEDLKVGDLAFCMGSHQSFQRFPREEVLPLPKGLSPETAVFARVMGITISLILISTIKFINPDSVN